VSAGERAYVFEGTRHDAELARLRALEAVFDEASRRCLLGAGLGAGWRCLEVGPGAGSIARWMSGVVGEAGHVLAVDTNTRFLAEPQPANLEVHEADICGAAIAPGSIDLAHARFVLIHVPQWMEAVAATLRCLRPGGWLVLEEPDFSASRSYAGRPELRRAFERVHAAIEAMFRGRALDHGFGARLPTIVHERGLEAATFENDAAIVRGGSPHALMMRMSTLQLRDKYVATGLASEQDIALYDQFATDPSCWATYHATIRAVGRKSP
jgi:SAM-dependent methyltransferase